MVERYVNSSELLSAAFESKLYKALVAQLEKDFGLANIPFKLSNSILPAELKALLHEKIYLLIMKKFASYLNLLYVVDVPERSFKDIEGTDVVEVSEQVSFLILKRELQKVQLKKKYSS